jgi:uncharacterized protein with HEPN domain
MPSELEEASLRDILHHIDLVQQFTAGQAFETFNTIAWKEMAGAGNIYRHDYQDVASRRVWDTVRLALPPLRTVIVAELSRFTSHEP